jgi:hypothetical protein
MAGTPAVGELWFNVTDSAIHMGDGVTLGGVKQAKLASVTLQSNTVSEALSREDLRENFLVEISEDSGGVGGSLWKVRLTSEVIPDGKSVRKGVFNPLLSLVQVDFRKLGTVGASVGYGVKNGSQTNTGLEIKRDWEISATSVQGFNVSDYFAVDAIAMNVFGSDIKIGDGTQGALFEIDHVNSFQSTDIIDVGAGAINVHLGFIDQNLLKSGTVKRTVGFTAVDILGGRDTPGFSTPGFEVSGSAIVNNQIGLSTLIRHGSNAKSIHCAAGNTDAGALLSSGGAPVDLECPLTVRQVAPTTNPLSGAIITTAGGIGSAGAIFGTDEISVNGVSPLFRLRNAGNIEVGQLFHNATDLLLYNKLNNSLKLGVNGASVVDVKSDRFIPSITSTLNSGDSTHRWIQSYVTIAENVSSDARTKEQEDTIPDLVMDAWGEVLAKTYKRRLAVTAKGSAARLHAGYLAQDIEAAFKNHGLNAFDYSLIGENTLTKEIEATRRIKVQRTERVNVERITFEKTSAGLVRKVVIDQEEIPLFEQLAVINEDGSPYLVEQLKEVDTGKVDEQQRKIFNTVSEMVPVLQDTPIMVEIDEPYTVTVKTKAKRLSLRYSECLVIESAYLRREISRLKGVVGI